MNGLTWQEQFSAWLVYRGYRIRRRWLTGQCPGCPKRWRGPHKFGCSYRPGRGLRINVARDEDGNLYVTDPVPLPYPHRKDEEQ